MDEQPPSSEQPTPPSGNGATPSSDAVAAYEPVAPSSRARHARVTALVIAVLVLLTGGGTVLLVRALNSEQSVDKFIPDSVAAYLKFSIHPSVQQQQALQDLLSRYPSDVRSQVGSKLDDVLDSALKDFGVSYRRDVKPWVGGQFAIAVLAPGRSTSDSPSAAPNVIGIVPVKDASAAQKTLTAMKNKVPKAPAFQIQGGVVYFGRTQSDIEAFQNAVTAGHTLADSSSYKREHDRAGGDGLFFAYADLSKLAGVAPLRGDILGGSALTGGSGIVAAGLRAEPQGIVLTGHSSLPKSASPGKAGTLKILPTTPTDLLGSISFYDLGDLVANALKALSRGFGIVPAAQDGQQVPGLPEVSLVLQEFERALGLNLQKDVLPWLKGEFSVIVGPATHPPIPNIGIVIQPTDRAALARTLKALRAHLGAVLGPSGKVRANASGMTVETPLGVAVVVRTTPDRVVIATGAAYADRLLRASAADLGNDTIYRSAVDPSKQTVFQLFVRLDRVRLLAEALAKLDDPTAYANYERNVQPFLKPLQALGIQSTVTGDSQDFRMIITVAKP